MTVETLFPERANLFGDSGNVRYLKLCLPQATFIDTAMGEEPAFVSRRVDLLIMGSLTERDQEKAIVCLRPYADRLRKRIGEDAVVLLTGNAAEVFGEKIENEDERDVEGLGLLPLIATRNRNRRYDAAFCGKWGDVRIVGFKSQFTEARSTQKGVGWIRTQRGMGLNPSDGWEGIRIRNLFATYLLGPFLVMNPPFTRYLLGLLGETPESLPYEEAAMEAYRRRLADFA